MPFNPPFNLPGQRVQEDAKDWGNSPYLPKVPSLAAILAVTDPLKAQFPFPANPSDEIAELIELSYLREVPTALVSTQPGRVRHPISRFLQVRPQPFGAVYNTLTPPTSPVIQTGRELARWFESETPGLGHRHALNYLLPMTSLSPPAQARIWVALDVTIYAAFLAAWHYKWTDPATSFRPRPIEIVPQLNVLFNFKPNSTGNGDGYLLSAPRPSPGTPRHPAYPSGHSTVGGAASAIIAYFFPDFHGDCEDLADNAGMARLWAGIHYRSDHEFGIAVGRAVAQLVIDDLMRDGVTAMP